MWLMEDRWSEKVTKLIFVMSDWPHFFRLVSSQISKDPLNLSLLLRPVYATYLLSLLLPTAKMMISQSVASEMSLLVMRICSSPCVHVDNVKSSCSTTSSLILKVLHDIHKVKPIIFLFIFIIIFNHVHNFVILILVNHVIIIIYFFFNIIFFKLIIQ